MVGGKIWNPMCMWPILSCRNYKFWMQFFERDIPIHFLSRNIYIFRRKKWQMDSSSMQQEPFFGGKNACVEWQRKRREGGDDKYLPSVRDINLLSSPLSGAAVQISISEGGLTRKEKKKVFSCRKSNTKTADGIPKLYHRKVILVKRPTNYTHLEIPQLTASSLLQLVNKKVSFPPSSFPFSF